MFKGIFKVNTVYWPPIYDILYTQYDYSYITCWLTGVYVDLLVLYQPIPHTFTDRNCKLERDIDCFGGRPKSQLNYF